MIILHLMRSCTFALYYLILLLIALFMVSHILIFSSLHGSLCGAIPFLHSRPQPGEGGIVPALAQAKVRSSSIELGCGCLLAAPFE